MSLSLAPGMERWVDAVEVEVAQDVVFPPDWIVQSVRARVSPVSIEVLHGEGGSGASQLEQLVGRFDGDFSGQHLSLGNSDLCRRDTLGAWLRHGAINGEAGFLQQCLRRIPSQLQPAHRLDGVWILPGMFLPAVGPGARLGANETDGVIDRRPGYAGIHRRLNDLKDRSVGGRVVVTPIS